MNKTFPFQMYDNRLGIKGEDARQCPELMDYMKRYRTTFVLDTKVDFWFFYPPEKYGKADVEVGNIQPNVTRTHNLVER